jgi:hypothetical protein
MAKLSQRSFAVSHSDAPACTGCVARAFHGFGTQKILTGDGMLKCSALPTRRQPIFKGVPLTRYQRFDDLVTQGQ